MIERSDLERWADDLISALSREVDPRFWQEVRMSVATPVAYDWSKANTLIRAKVADLLLSKLEVARG